VSRSFGVRSASPAVDPDGITHTRRYAMYVVAQHTIKDSQAAFTRGQRLIKGQGAPSGTRALQFYPSTDRSAVTCLWEAESVADVQGYVDATLGDSSENTCYDVDAGHAFADRPLGLPASPA